MVGYRSRSSYIAKSPEAKARQLANLKRGKGRPKPIGSQHTGGKVNIKDNIIAFAEGHFVLPETRRPIVLLDWEKDIFRGLFDTEPRPTLALLGMPKKSGKSTLAAVVALWMLLTKPMAEIYIMGPDIQQGQLVVFDKIRKAIRMHPYLRKICKVSKDRIECKKTEGSIQVLACSKTAAGLNPDLVILDELWQFDTDESKRAIDEMTNVPNKDNLILVVTYAGYQDSEDTHLWKWYKAGIDQAEGREEKDERFYFLWRTDYEDVPWVTKNYLTLQKKRLRENTYRRLHQNEWVSGEEAFIDADVIDVCTNPDYKRGLPFKGRVAAGIDIGLKHDSSAIALVGKIDETTLAIIDHIVFIPKGKQTLDLEKTVEATMELFSKQYDLTRCYYDPFQFARSAKTLQGKGLYMVEYPQTVDNLVRMAETLQGLLKTAGLMLYENQELRQHLLNAKVKEHARGWRLIKGRQSKKIDLAIALAMACQSAAESFLLKGGAGIYIEDDDDEDEPNANWHPCGEIEVAGW